MKKLLLERNKLRGEIKKLSKEYDTLAIYPIDDPKYNERDTARGKEIQLMISIYNARQLAMKVSMNSIYGFLKVRKGGKLPFPDGARTITAMGRGHIMDCNNLMSTDIEKLISNLQPEDIPDVLKQYDIKTPCEIVYNDTDSCFVKVNHIEPQHIATYGKMLQKAFSYIFDESLILEYEQTLKKILLVTKKRYTGFIMNDDTGEILRNKNTGEEEMYTKGLVTAKRDGAQFMRDVFNKVANNILAGADAVMVLQIICNEILKLFSDEVKPNELSMMKKIGYEYKSPSAEMNLFKNALK